MFTSSTILFAQNSSCLISQVLSSYEVWKDFILPILIAFSAGYMVYWTFIRQTRHDKQKELEAEKQLQRDKLYYFANSVKTIFAISRDQNAATLAFVEAQLKDLSEVKELLLFSLNELRRMTQDLQLESYMLAYVNYYGIDRKAAIKEFNNIVVRIDMLYETFKHIEEHHHMAQEIDQKYKVNLLSLRYRASNLVAVLSVSLRKSAPLLAQELDQFAVVFHASPTGNNDAGFYHQHFFVPFNRFAVKYVSSDLPEVSQIQELAILTRDGKAIYEQLINENQRVAEDFKNQYDRLKTEIELLKEHSKRLLEDFGG